jgi:hypothetical protein
MDLKKVRGQGTDWIYPIQDRVQWRILTITVVNVTFADFTTLRMMMMMMIMFFWILAPCILVGRCQRFGETYCLHLQG